MACFEVYQQYHANESSTEMNDCAVKSISFETLPRIKLIFQFSYFRSDIYFNEMMVISFKDVTIFITML